MGRIWGKYVLRLGLSWEDVGTIISCDWDYNWINLGKLCPDSGTKMGRM